MHKQGVKNGAVNKPDELKIETGFVEMEERLAYSNMDETKANEYKYFLIVLIFLIGIVAFGCEDREKEINSNSPQTPSSSQQLGLSEMVASSANDRQQAVNRINYLFKDELSPIKPEQVQRINKQQFVQWLRNSSIAAAEKQYLEPLLASDVSEFILLNKVTVTQTGKQATLAMVAVPTQLINRYTKLLVLTAYKEPFLGWICMWFQCDNLDPNMCLCLAKIGTVPLTSSCPISECHPFNKPCLDQTGEPCKPSSVVDLVFYW